MNILGVGGWELALIFIIMLIVAGPKRMIHWAYLLGRYTAQLRDMWGEVVDMIQREFDDAGVDVKLPREIPTRRDVSRYANEALRPFQEEVDRAVEEYRKEAEDIEESLKVDLDLEDEKAAATNKNGRASKKTPQDGKSKSDYGTWSTPATPEEDQE